MSKKKKKSVKSTSKKQAEVRRYEIASELGINNEASKTNKTNNMNCKRSCK